MTWKSPISGALPLAPPPDAALVKPQPFVVPVRYVAAGEVVHASTISISLDDVRVRSIRPAASGLSIELKLFFPVEGVVTRSAVVTESQGEEFRAGFTDTNDLARQRLSEALWRRELIRRPCARFHTQLRAVLRERERPQCEGYVSNISRSGAFVRLESLAPEGSVVELEITMPEGAVHNLHAYVVHVAARRGVGVQFIGTSEEFSADLNAYLSKLSRSPV